MYRYSRDGSITYTAADMLLFKESPFASWMERLTLENPDHGVLPDRDVPADDVPPPRADMARALSEVGRNVVLVDTELDEVERRRQTIAAMREGVDFIVNGQLAHGPLSDRVNLLTRSTGFSDLGTWLYLPCDTDLKTTLHSALRLCFLADLLHSLQGAMPPQMLIIRGGRDLVPLDTDTHIHHYLGVKQRFMRAQREFRKHRMPDPVASSHFGRWSDCANHLLRRRAESATSLSDADGPATPVTESATTSANKSRNGTTLRDQAQHVDLAALYQPAWRPGVDGAAAVPVQTLADQARALADAEPLPVSAEEPTPATAENLELIVETPAEEESLMPLDYDITRALDRLEAAEQRLFGRALSEPDPVPGVVDEVVDEPAWEVEVPPFDSRLHTSTQTDPD